GKCAALSGLACNAHQATMGRHNALDIMEPEAKSFHIVNVACGYAKELLKNTLLVFCTDANAIILYFYAEKVIVVIGFDCNLRRTVIVFDGVVNQVVEYVGDMKPIGHERGYMCLQITGDRSAFMLCAEGMLTEHFLYELVNVDLFLLQVYFFSVQLGHLEHTLYL